MITFLYPRKKYLLMATLALMVLVAALGITTPVSASGSTLTVDLTGNWPASVAVQLWSGDGSTLLWTVANQQGGIRNYAVTPGTYDVKFIQGANTYLREDVDCSSDCSLNDVSADLTVDLNGNWPASVAVQLLVNGGDPIWTVANQQGGERHYRVLKNEYDLKLVQGSESLTVDVDCSGGDCAAADILADMSVDLSGTWMASVAVQLLIDEGSPIWTVANQQGAVRHYTVLRKAFDLKLVQGTDEYLIDIDCSNGSCAADDVAAALTVDLSGAWLASVAVQLLVDGGSPIWTAANQHGGVRQYNVFRNHYDLKLVQGTHAFPIDLDCTSGSCTAGSFMADLTVDLSGSWLASVSVQLLVDGGSPIWTAANQHGDERHYNVFRTPYDLKLVQGAEVFAVDIDCTSGGCTAGDVAAALTVDLSGAWLASVAVQLRVAGGDPIWTAANQHGGLRVYNVLPDTYDLKLVQGSMVFDVAGLNCEDGSCDAGDVSNNLTVDLSGSWLASVSVQLLVNDGSPIWTAANQHGGTRVYQVLPATYDLKLVQSAKILDIADIPCATDCDAGDFVANLAVELSGSWPASIAVGLHLDDAAANSVGSMVWGAANQHGALRNYNVLKGFYDVKLTMGANGYIWDAVNCTGETCTLDKSTLIVDFPGISSVHVYLYNSDNTAGTASGSLIATQLYKNNQALFANLNNGKYDLKLVKGAKTLIVDNVIVLGGYANAGTLVSTMTVNFDGINSVHTYVKVDDGVVGTATGGDVEQSLYKADSTTIVVLKGVYDVRLVRGAAAYLRDAVNCNTDCTVTNTVSTLTVNFPGLTSVHTYVKTNDGNSGTATGGDVDQSLYKNDGTTLVVLKGVYDVRVTKGAQANIYDAVDCTSNCLITDIVKTLTINFPGITSVHSYVKVNDNTPNSATGGDVDQSLYKNDGTTIVVLKGVYDVRVVKGAQANIYDAVDCTDSGSCTITDIVKTLTINFPGINSVHSYVKANDNNVGTANGGDVDQSLYKNNSTTIVVLKGFYDVRVVKGAQVNLYDAVDCTDSGSCTIDNIVATLTIKFPGMTSIHNYIKVPDGNNNAAAGGDVDSRLYQNNETVLAVLKGFYDVRIVKGSDSFIYDNVDCTGNTCTLDKSTLTVNFPGISSVHTYVYPSNNVAGTVGGALAGSQTYKTDQAIFANLANGVYDVKVVKGAEVKIIDNVTVLGNWAAVNDIVATLTVNFPGISSVHTYVKVNNGVVGTATGGDVDNRTYKTGYAELVVLRDVYDIRVVKGAQVLIVDAVNCNAATCTVNDIVATLTINFPGIASVHSYVKVNDGVGGSASGGDVDNRTYKTDEAQLVVLRSTYDVKVVKGAEVKIIDNVNCTSGSCTVDDIVATLTINFSGISSVHSYVKVNDGVGDSASGGDVDNRTYKTDEAQLVVLRSTYDVKVVKGAEVKIIDAVDCTGATCTVTDIVATLTINFPGIASVHSYVKVDDGQVATATGGDVDNRTYKTDAAALVVLRDVYDVRIVKGAQAIIVDGVNCNADACQINDIVATLTVEFPGISSVHTYVKVNDNTANSATGGDVDNRTYKTDAVTLTVLRTSYDLRIVKGAAVYIADAVDCTTGSCTVTNIVATLTVNFPGVSSVHTYVKLNDGTPGTANGSDVDNRTYKSNQVVLAVLQGTYDVRVVKGSAVNIFDAVDCTAAACEINNAVTGSGTLGAAYGSPTVEFNSNAAPVGTFSIVYPSGTGHSYEGAVVSGQIICVRFAGNTAYVAGKVTASNAAAWLVNQYVRFGVQDDGVDGLNYTAGEAGMPDCATFTHSADLPLVAGDFAILP